jgi:hypothetical protein
VTSAERAGQHGIENANQIDRLERKVALAEQCAQTLDYI